MCICNNNIDPSVPGSCDGDTGECLKCQFHTTGFACEHCETGYHGDATMQNCAECVCNELGTNKSMGACNRVTGQCPCLPNVVGVSCDQCDVNTWDLGNPLGCQSCDCDGLGSTNSQCNLLDGRCDCVDGRGGDKCADCEDLNYGDPLVQCFACDCNMQGSNSTQCHRRTGQCPCVEGVTGEKCDRCARGTTGDLPNCVPCGECFDNWDHIIQNLKAETHDLVKRASEVSVTGAINAFDSEFKMMQANLDEIKSILGNLNYTQGDLDNIMNMLDQVKSSVQENTKKLNTVDKQLSQINAKVQNGNITLEHLRDKVDRLRQMANDLKKNATDIQIKDFTGAFDKIKEAERDSKMAQDKVDATNLVIQQSEKIRDDTEMMLKNKQSEYDSKLQENQDRLDELDENIDSLDEDLGDINSMVCGGTSSPCDGLCGGGGCGMCGGPGCSGAKTL